MAKLTIADLEKKKAQLDAQIRQIKAKEVEQKRKEEARVKSIFGSYMIHCLEGQPIESINEQINLRKTQFTYPRSKLRGISENYPFGS
ncbi:hypothetical protein PsalN5692_03790 (plasmid) [Piscirickettsia salmonis]|nr:hypothetical protein PsalN5692_03790 [Piscirickettsia salmonis]